jgi:hypothetical protein
MSSRLEDLDASVKVTGNVREPYDTRLDGTWSWMILPLVVLSWVVIGAGYLGMSYLLGRL